jgi:hypothetical protein
MFAGKDPTTGEQLAQTLWRADPCSAGQRAAGARAARARRRARGLGEVEALARAVDYPCHQAHPPETNAKLCAVGAVCLRLLSQHVASAQLRGQVARGL